MLLLSYTIIDRIGCGHLNRKTPRTLAILQIDRGSKLPLTLGWNTNDGISNQTMQVYASKIQGASAWDADIAWFVDDLDLFIWMASSADWPIVFLWFSYGFPMVFLKFLRLSFDGSTNCHILERWRRGDTWWHVVTRGDIIDACGKARQRQSIGRFGFLDQLAGRLPLRYSMKCHGDRNIHQLTCHQHISHTHIYIYNMIYII